MLSSRSGLAAHLRARAASAAGLLALTTTLVVALSSPSAAAGPGVYGAWTLAGSGTSWSGTVAVAAAGFPAVSYTSDTTTPFLDTTAFLGASTPFGAAFGSSQGSNYLRASTSSDGDSHTTFTFASPTPASGWGFALGDIDVDQVTVTATDALGNPVPTASLGFQGVFNFCDNTPRPAACPPLATSTTGAPPASDTPTWDAGTATLVGHGTDTTGADGWFEPTVPVKTLTFVFHAQRGKPIYQIWFAAIPAVAPTTTSTTTTLAPTTTAAPSTTAAPATTAAPTTAPTGVLPESTAAAPVVAQPTFTG